MNRLATTLCWGSALACALVLALPLTAGTPSLSSTPGFVAPGGDAVASAVPASPAGSFGIADHSFENGPPPASAWTEVTSPGGCEWIVDPAAAWGMPALDGVYAAWLGGYCNPHGPATTGITQSVTVPASAQGLAFWMLSYRPELDDADPDEFNVRINGTVVYTLAMVQANDTYPTWVEQTIDVSAYAGQAISLQFEGVSRGDGTGNVLVDNVHFVTVGDPPIILPAYTPVPVLDLRVLMLLALLVGLGGILGVRALRQ